MSHKDVALSLVLPAYNEAQRLPPYLSAIRAYADQRYAADYEVVVVDDGSHDGLIELLEPMAAGWPQLRWLRHAENRGKGAAVRSGMLAAAGQRLLFADADGATPIVEIEKLAAALDSGADVAIGSRLAVGADCTRGWRRALVGRAFAALARRLLRLKIRDTQCGFKLFRREAGRRLFGLATEDGYLFDLELLALARQCGLTVVEVPICWRDAPGGHLRPLGDLPRIVGDLWRLTRRLRRGLPRPSAAEPVDNRPPAE